MPRPLLDDDEVGLAFDHPLDPLVFMAGDDNEVIALLDDPFVLAALKLDLAEAGSSAAFTVERRRR